MIFILSNIFFGHPKLSKYQLEYFNNYLLQLIQKNKPQKIVISGNIFYNTNNVSFKLLNDVANLFMNISSYTVIEIVGNDYCFSILEYFGNLNDHMYRGNIINNKWYGGDAYVGEKIDISPFENISLFQLSKNDTNKIGYNIVKNGKIAFVENKQTPRFVQYQIKSIEELEELEISRNFIDLEIDSELLDKAEYKNKIDIYLSKNSFNNVFYTEKKKIEEKVVVDNKNLNIRNILENNIEDELKDELKEIFTIYDENR